MDQIMGMKSILHTKPSHAFNAVNSGYTLMKRQQTLKITPTDEAKLNTSGIGALLQWSKGNQSKY